MRPISPTKSAARRVVLLAFLLVAIWQLVILGLSLRFAWNAEPQPEVTVADSHYAASLIHPTPAELTVAFAVLNDEWQRLVKLREELNETYPVKARKMLMEAAQVHKQSKKPTDWEYRISMFYDESLRAARAGVEGQEVLAVLDMMAQEPLRQASDWQSIIKQAQLCLLFIRHRDWEACEMIASGKPYEDRHGNLVCQQLLVYGPPDRSIAGRLLRIDLINSLSIEYSGGISYREPWEMLRVAPSPTLLVQLLLRVASFSKEETFHRAIAQINAAYFADRQLWGETIATLADCAERQEQFKRAIILYKMAAEVAPSSRSVGRSLFNRGYLLRTTGYTGQAITALKQIFPSNANEQDPGGHLMEAYRNYRHRAALEIASAYADRHNYPASFYYQWMAAYQYEYRSWCGTCRWGEDAAMRKRLINTSLAAGPLFAVANILIAPITNWRIWLLLIIFWWVSRKFVRHLKHAPTEVNSRADT